MNIFKWWFQKSELRDLKAPVLSHQASASSILSLLRGAWDQYSPSIAKTKGNTIYTASKHAANYMHAIYFIAPLYFLYF